MARFATVALVALLVLPLVPAASAQDPAQDLPRHGDVPATFSVANPLVGDAGSYERSIVRWDGESLTTVEEPYLHESFRVEAPRDHYGADGRPHRVNDVHVWLSRGSTLQEDQHQFTDATDGQLVAVRTLESGPDYYTERTWFPGTSFTEEWAPLCGLQNFLQSSIPVAVSNGTALFGQPCRLASSGRSGQDAVFVPVRADAWGQETAVGFQQMGTPLVVLVWFTPSLPYPVRILEQLDGQEDRFAMLDLTGSTRGTDAVAGPGDVPVAQSLPALRLAPHDGVGADETGITHPFPWSEAWSVASADEQVGRFLADHPQAVVERAVYNEWVTTQSDGTTETTTHIDRWWFRLDDGRMARHFRVERQQDSTAILLPVAGRTPAPAGDDVRDVVTDIEAVPSGIDAQGLGRPLPDVASATTWWLAFASPSFAQQGANGWMHFLSPGGVGASTGAGYLRQDVGDQSSHWEASYLLVTPNGRAALLNENMRDADYGLPASLARRLAHAIGSPLATILEEALADQLALAGLGPGADVLPSLGDNGAGEGTTLAVNSAGSAKASATTAGGLSERQATLLAAGTASLVGLGWLAKVGWAALFSRLRRDRVLEQPVRRRVMEAIEADPGVHLSRLVAVTGQGAGTVRHHVAKLVEAGLVQPHHAAGYLCYFPKGARAGEQAAAPVLKSEGARRVFEGLDGHALGVRPLATAVGLAPSTVEHHLARLQAAGLVRREGTTYVRADGGARSAPA